MLTAGGKALNQILSTFTCPSLGGLLHDLYQGGMVFLLVLPGCFFMPHQGMLVDAEFPTYDSMMSFDLHFVWYSFFSVAFCCGYL